MSTHPALFCFKHTPFTASHYTVTASQVGGSHTGAENLLQPEMWKIFSSSQPSLGEGCHLLVARPSSLGNIEFVSLHGIGLACDDPEYDPSVPHLYYRVVLRSFDPEEETFTVVYDSSVLLGVIPIDMGTRYSSQFLHRLPAPVTTASEMDVYLYSSMDVAAPFIISAKSLRFGEFKSFLVDYGTSYGAKDNSDVDYSVSGVKLVGVQRKLQRSYDIKFTDMTVQEFFHEFVDNGFDIVGGTGDILCALQLDPNEEDPANPIHDFLLGHVQGGAITGVRSFWNRISTETTLLESL